MKNAENSLYIVVGAGLSGMAAARLLHRTGKTVRLLDVKGVTRDFARWAADNGVEIRIGAHAPQDFADAAVVVPSPGVAASVIRSFLPAENPPVIMAETELAFRELCGEKVLAITGTSGKTTTTSLASAMLREQGFSVFTGGNIGTPLSEYVLQRLDGHPAVDVCVLELSSFQLQTCSTLRPDVAVLLNISANHLDYHADMAEYIAAKARIFACQTPDDTAVLGEDLRELPETLSLTAKTRYFGQSNRFSSMRLLGRHNKANAEAAFQACAVLGVTEEAAARALAAFEPLEHRLEVVTERRGVLFVNDSKCTTVEAMRVALEAFDRPVLLLAGGKFKGGDLAGLRPLVREKVRHVALYGAGRRYFEEAWNGLSLSWDETLETAMCRLSALARANDVILLAPATASYDQYPNYLERGRDFKRIALEVLR